MAKKEATLTAICPQCEWEGEMIPNLELKAASNVTVLQCFTCEWEFAKDQSVKIPGNLVLQASRAMNIHEGYSSLGEYVRDAVRRMNEVHLQRYSQEQMAEVVSAIVKDPETFAKMISDSDEDEEE